MLLQIECQEVLLEDADTSKALIDYTKANMIDTLVFGASTRSGFVRLVVVPWLFYFDLFVSCYILSNLYIL